MIKRVMEDYVRQRHIEEGFEYVGTPHISKEGLFHTSGHLPYYAETMYPPMEFENAEVPAQGDELPDAQPDLPVARAGPTASCRCGSSSSAASTGSRSPASCTA